MYYIVSILECDGPYEYNYMIYEKYIFTLGSPEKNKSNSMSQVDIGIKLKKKLEMYVKYILNDSIISLLTIVLFFSTIIFLNLYGGMCNISPKWSLQCYTHQNLSGIYSETPVNPHGFLAT